MKKLLSLLGIVGLMAFVAMPIYAQDVEEDINVDENIVAEADDMANESENVIADDGFNYNEVSYDDFAYWVDNEGYAQEFTEEDIANEISNAVNNLSDEELAWLVAILWGLWFFAVIRGYCLYVFTALQPISKWEIYRKAGKKGWAFLIPFWGTMVYSEIGGISQWFWLLPWIAWIWSLCIWFIDKEIYWIVMLILIFIAWIWWIVATYRIARKYGWGVFASILHVLFTPITSLILWLGNYKYEGKSK